MIETAVDSKERRFSVSNGREPEQGSKMAKKINLFYANVNEKGKSTTLATRVTPETNAVVERIIQSGKAPWRTKSEFIRDAVSNFIEDYAELETDLLPDVLTVIRKMQERSFRVEVRARLVETVVSSSEEMELYIRTGEYDRLVEELEDICSIILSLRNDPFWLKLTVLEFTGSPVISRAFEIANKKGAEGCISEVIQIVEKVEKSRA